MRQNEVYMVVVQLKFLAQIFVEAAGNKFLGVELVNRKYYLIFFPILSAIMALAENSGL